MLALQRVAIAGRHRDYSTCARHVAFRKRCVSQCCRRHTPDSVCACVRAGINVPAQWRARNPISRQDTPVRIVHSVVFAFVCALACGGAWWPPCAGEGLVSPRARVLCGTVAVTVCSVLVWYGMVWYDGIVWYGQTRAACGCVHGSNNHDMVWYVMVWYGMVWYGTVGSRN